MKLNLDRIANLAIIVSCVLMSAVMLNRLVGDGAASSSAAEEHFYKVGQPVTHLGKTRLEARKKTLLVFVRSDCSFCTNSMEFYSRLVKRASAAADGAHVLFVGSESGEIIRAYLEQNGVRAPGILSLPWEDLRIRSTPTLVLLDKDSIVEHVWIGQQGSEQEHRILAAVSTS